MDVNELLGRAEGSFLGREREERYDELCEKIKAMKRDEARELACELLRITLYQLNMIEVRLKPRIEAMEKILFTNEDDGDRPRELRKRAKMDT